MRILSLILLLFPTAAGILFALSGKASRRALNIGMVIVTAAEALLGTLALFLPSESFTLFSLSPVLTASLKLDAAGKVFLAIAVYGILAASVYATRYMEHEGRHHTFYAFMLFSEASLVGMDLSETLIAMYFFFEMLTFLSMPLVLHDLTQESVRAAMKYLFYSVAGAFLGLFAIFALARFAPDLTFAAGGILDTEKLAGHETLVLVAAFLGIIGFGAKAGMYPLHGWLPTAHPVAPAPASAVLSGIIAKAGVLAALRLLYFVVGPALLRGTWVQYALLGLSLLTVFMGSMMAYREKEIKKRLAYSSVSQISYIMTGLFLMTQDGLTGGLLHVAFHACIKVCLFMVAGSFIVNANKRMVDDLTGIGQSMPITLWSFTLASLSLIGIPPAGGFVSKWYLAVGALKSGLPVYGWLAPVILLVSALLTAGYLLPITIRGFFPGKDFRRLPRTDEGGPRMWVPILVLSVLSVVLGIAASPLTDAMQSLAALLV